jgi:uncharacterized protein
VPGPDPTPRRPQDPIPPYPYEEEQARYENRAARVTLAGTLTKPRAEGRFPAALLLTGSGPHDRNETVLGHRPFLVLADHLTRHGIAVLRSDDRGVGESTGDFAAAAADDFAADALAAVDFLKGRSDVRADGIGLIGHSDGGVIAPKVAAESPDVGWIVMLAGPGVPGDRLLLEQNDLISAAMGVPDDVRAPIRELNRAIYGVVMREVDNSVAQREIEQLINQHAALVSAASETGGEELLAQLRGQIPRLTGPWFRDFLGYDPGPALRNVKVPVLALNGELDLQVPPALNLPAIVAALEKGANADYAAVKLPRLNHLFQTATTGSPAEYAAIEETFAPVALGAVSDWISWRF